MSDGSNLTAEELRVLACLIEKSHTTPDQYPLSSNALMNACNQKSSRDPVVAYTVQQVDETLQLLRDAGWVRMIRAKGNRTFKHRHVIDEKLGLSDPQQAVFAVLALRGPQSPGELKTRTERYHRFEDLADVERVLESLRDREVPLSRNVGRASGQSQDRWIQLLGPNADGMTAAGSAGAQIAVDDASVTAPGGVEVAGPPRTLLVDFMTAGGESPEAAPTGAWTGDRVARVNGAGVDVMHVSLSGASFREAIHGVQVWNGLFSSHPAVVARAGTPTEISAAAERGCTAVLLSLPNLAALEGDIGLIEICSRLGVHIMAVAEGSPLTVAGGEGDGDSHAMADQGLTVFGGQAVAEMNRVGVIVDLVGAGERSARDAIDASADPVAVSGCRPSWWEGRTPSLTAAPAASHEVLQAVTEGGGVIGLSAAVGPVDGYAELVAEAATRYGPEHLAIGSGLPGSTAGPGTLEDDRLVVDQVVDALSGIGFLAAEVEGLTGGNWTRLYQRVLG